MTVVDEKRAGDDGESRPGARASRPLVAGDSRPSASIDPSEDSFSGDPSSDDSLVRSATDVLVVVGAALFVFWQLHPGLILADTTPAGGDMGAHVWAFGYLRDVLLPSGQMSGWTPDWYAGFPAFHFYMVVPFLGMVALNAGLSGIGMLVPAATSMALTAWGALNRRAGVDISTAATRITAVLGGTLAIAAIVGLYVGFAPGFAFTLMAMAGGAAVLLLVYPPPGVNRTRARLVATGSLMMAVFGIALPYGVAFKVLSVSGVVAMPVAAYLFGRLSGLRYPIPALLAVGTTAFLFDTNFTIYGGNITSTMAGEFAFSISLAFALAYLGVLVRGLRTGRHRVPAAVLLALTGLCHLIPAFFALCATAVLVIAHLVAEKPARPPRVSTDGADAESDDLPASNDRTASDEVTTSDDLTAPTGRSRHWYVSVAGIAAVAAILVLGGGVAAISSITTPPIVAVTVVALVITVLFVRLALPPKPFSMAAEPMWPGDEESAYIDGGAEPGVIAPRVASPDSAVVTETGTDSHAPPVLVQSEPDDRGPVIEGVWGFFGVARLWWLGTMGLVAALLAAWWVLPFYAKRTYLNDMGWGKTAVHEEGEALWAWFTDEVWSELVHSDQQVYAVLALLGAVVSIVFANRVASSLAILGLVIATAFVFLPQGRLWNARLLPFWYLLIYLMAAIAVGEVVRAAAEVLGREPGRPVREITWVAAPLAALAVGLFLAAQLHHLPLLGETLKNAAGEPTGEYKALGISVNGKNVATDWSTWNYKGYERKDAYPEYKGVVDTMAGVGETNGCGRALWEYNPKLNDYGTPMALMLLPHWSDGCIGSMEGLYFEASSTTPFHFLMQSELSQEPSRAQRDMPYRDFDIDAGVQHLQLMGVRYYMAYTPEATQAARAHPDLTEVATSSPWTIYEVANAPLAQGLQYQPVVTTAGEAQDEWLCSGFDETGRCSGPALDWFQDSAAWDVALAASGPDDWARVDPGADAPREAIEPAVVSDVEEDRDGISFTVDQPGKPVLVKASYFPNWRASGADGPYRVAPNLMVVVPTDTEVQLSYGRIGVDYAAWALTLIGIAAVVVLTRRARVGLPALYEPVEVTSHDTRPDTERP